MVTYSAKMAKDTNFNFGTRALRKSPDMAHEKILEKGAWQGKVRTWPVDWKKISKKGVARVKWRCTWRT